MTTLTGAEVARLIDHTLLKPEAQQEQILKLCDEARQFHFASVCVNPVYVPLCADTLGDLPDIKICTVIGFPLGSTLPAVKAYETQQALEVGATEIDMVLQVGALKSQDYDLVRRDISAVVDICHAHGTLCKVILETGLLTDEEKETGCRIAQDTGADFVKTSTGFGPGGATPTDIALMRHVVGPVMGVKASGGVRTYADVLAMLAAGATRIGASAGVRIVEEALGQADPTTPTGGY